MEGRAQIDGDNGVPLLDRKLVNRCHVLNARVVDEDVDRTELPLRLGDHIDDLVMTEHIGRIEGHSRTVRGHRADRFGIILLVTKAVHHHIAAVLGECVGNAKADAGGRAGHHGGLACEGHGGLAMRRMSAIGILRRLRAGWLILWPGRRHQEHATFPRLRRPHQSQPDRGRTP